MPYKYEKIIESLSNNNNFIVLKQDKDCGGNTESLNL